MRQWLVLVAAPARVRTGGAAHRGVRYELRRISARDDHSIISITNLRANPLPYCFRAQTSWKHSPARQIKVMRSQIDAGAPEEIRTPDPQIRSLVLYPAELRARFSLSIWGRKAHRCRMQSETIFSDVTKARHSYRLRPGLARSGNGPPPVF